MEITHVEDDGQASGEFVPGDEGGRNLWLELSEPVTDGALVLLLTKRLNTGHQMRVLPSGPASVGRLVVEDVSPQDDQRVLTEVREFLVVLGHLPTPPR
ncbi:hypothetical protein V3N99_15810 [Dermatophilaceae bacterium Soc4.6]